MSLFKKHRQLPLVNRIRYPTRSLSQVNNTQSKDHPDPPSCMPAAGHDEVRGWLLGRSDRRPWPHAVEILIFLLSQLSQIRLQPTAFYGNKKPFNRHDFENRKPDSIGIGLVARNRMVDQCRNSCTTLRVGYSVSVYSEKKSNGTCRARTTSCLHGYLDLWMRGSSGIRTSKDR